MTENIKFEVGDRISIDSQDNVMVVALRCPLCATEGHDAAVATPATRVWVPALLERWVPEHKRKEGFISLEEAIAKDARLTALVGKRNDRKEASRLCSKHGLAMRAAKIWTTQLSVVMGKQAAAANRRATEAFGSIASMLGGEQVGEIEEAVGKAETRRTKAADRKAQREAQKAEGSEGSDGHKPKNPRKIRQSRRGQEESEA